MQASTIIPTKEQTLPISGVARSIEGQPESGFFLVCPNGIKVALPNPLVKVLLLAAKAMTEQNGITVVVRSSWLTTQEAADLMGYSRQVVVDLIKKDKLKASQLGTHRRIKLSDLMDFIEKEDRQRSKALADLAVHTEEIGGYELDKGSSDVGRHR